jgi:hypothetical protein
MSAAATAAGYLYASGRLRGRGAKDQQEAKQPEKPQPPRERRPMRVAVYEPREDHAPAVQPQDKPRRTPKIEYRTRRWRPDGDPR